MRIFSVLSIIGAMATGLMASNAEALTPSPVPGPQAEVILVAGGCGVGFHRNIDGACVPNVGVYGGGVYRGGAYYRGGAHYRGGAYYRGGAHYRGGYHRGGVHRGGGRRR